VTTNQADINQIQQEAQVKPAAKAEIAQKVTDQEAVIQNISLICCHCIINIGIACCLINIVICFSNGRIYICIQQEAQVKPAAKAEIAQKVTDQEAVIQNTRGTTTEEKNEGVIASIFAISSFFTFSTSAFD
jgi:hypothetical protein